jgi:hypothetical protein
MSEEEVFHAMTAIAPAQRIEQMINSLLRSKDLVRVDGKLRRTNV